MKTKPTFKAKMTFEEMSEVFTIERPLYIPNRINVGKFAKSHGFSVLKQVVNHKQIYFYVNPELL